MKRTALIFALTLLSLLSAGSTSPLLAQESPEEIAKKYGISFPISQLGNCDSYTACRSFCEDPVHLNSCVDFAKKKGFYKEGAIKEEVINRAKEEFGCDTTESCKTFCEKEANFDRCDAFAKKHNLSGGHVRDVAKEEILDKAKESLGCDSPSSCRTFCEQEQHRQQCSAFAQKVGLHGGESNKGPGGCTSESTCKVFCADPNNFQICSGYSASTGGKFKGPGGCDSEQSCRSYCEQHEDECQRLGGDENPAYDPAEMCRKTLQCRWEDNRCQCGFYGEDTKNQAEEYAKFCRQHPDKCGPGQSANFDSSQKRQEYEQYCRENPDKCRLESQSSGDPAKACAQYSGCSWTGTTCQCPQSNPQPTYTNTSSSVYPTQPSSSTTTTTNDPATMCAKTSGCSWTGSTCQCAAPTIASSGSSQPTPPPPTSGQTSGTNTGSSPDPATECSKQSGCSWTGSSCQCSTSTQVQGASISRTLLQFFLQFLLNVGK